MTGSKSGRNRRSAVSQTRRLAVLVVAMLAVALGAAACSGDDDAEDDTAADAPAEALSMQHEETTFSTAAAASEEMSDSDDMDMAEEMAMEDEDMMEDDGSAAVALASGVPGSPADSGREIIRTARIAVETADVAAAAEHATSIIEELGGFVFSQDTRTQDRPRTVLTFKVRPAQFSAALDRLSNVGELVEQTVNAEDVTDIVVDLGSRISTAEISVKRLREFLSQATEVEGVAELERELASRETNLERLRGQLRSLRERVDLATITLSITESVEAVPDTSVILRAWIAEGDDDPCLGFSDVVAPADGEVSLCIEVENDGETALTGTALTSNTLRFDNDDLELSEGADLERIEPGERPGATLRYAITDGRIAGRVATRGLDIDIRLSAVPVTAEGAELPRLARGATLHLYLAEDDTSPGFGDALSGGWGALVSLATGIGLVVVALLAWLPVIAIALWAAWWWLRRRRRARQQTRTAVAANADNPADDV